MARRSRGSRRSTSREVHNQLWITTVIDGIVFDDTPVIQTNLMIGADWIGASVGLERATIMVVRGWLAL